MSRILQTVYFVCYGLAALAIAFIAPKLFPETPRSVAWLAGAVVFLAGALMHEIASRCYQSSLDRHRLAVLHRAYVEAMEDIDRMSVELRSLKHKGLDAAAALPVRDPEPAAPAVAYADDGPDRAPAIQHDEPPSEPEASTADGKLRQALLRRLYASPAGGSGDDAGTAVVSGSLIERETLNAVRDALRKGDVDLYLQPVVTLPQRKSRHFDCDVRLVSERGDYMPPALYTEILRANDLVVPVDNMLLYRTVEEVGASQLFDAGSYGFCRIAPATLVDRAFFQDFLDYLGENDELVSRVSFEFTELDVIELDETGAQGLGALVDMGFHLCISDLRNFDVEADQLSEGGVRFVKVDAVTLMPAVTDEAEAARVRRLKSDLDAQQIDLIVTGVESEQVLVELLDFDLDLGQGPLFGEARKGGDAAVSVAGTRHGRA
ncbi:MAG: EAL domain-containing protein [Pseudomonadota bacterium]